MFIMPRERVWVCVYYEVSVFVREECVRKRVNGYMSACVGKLV